MKAKIASGAVLRPRTSDSQQSKVRLTVGSRELRHELATKAPSTRGFTRSTFVTQILPSFIILLFAVVGYYFLFIKKYDVHSFSAHLPVNLTSNYSANTHQPPLRPIITDSKATESNVTSLQEVVEAKFNSLNISQSLWNRSNYEVVSKLHKVVLQSKITLYWKSMVLLKDCKGIVLLLSSCHGTGLEWWSTADTPTFEFDSSKSLPVEISIAKAYVKHGYWVVSMSGVEKRKSSRCWVNEDYVHVATAINFMQLLRVRYTEVATSSPVHVLGIMNGGVLVSNSIIRWQSLSLPLTFTSITLMNCGMWNRDYEKKNPRVNYPPVLFIDFQRNGDLALHNNETVAKLQKVGIPAMHLSSDPLPLTPGFFSSRLHGIGLNITKEESRKMYKGMLDADFIWPGSGVLVNDVAGHIHLTKLQRTLQKAVPRVYLKIDALRGIFSPTLQILRQAWGFRETNDEFIPEMLRWIEIRGALLV